MDIASLVEIKKNPKIPDIAPGDTVKVSAKIVEGGKERVQVFQGVIIKVRRGGAGTSFTVRHVASGIGVERTFPLYSPLVEKVEVVRHGKVRRAKLYYLRKLSGKEARRKIKRVDRKVKKIGEELLEPEPEEEIIEPILEAEPEAVVGEEAEAALEEGAEAAVEEGPEAAVEEEPKATLEEEVEAVEEEKLPKEAPEPEAVVEQEPVQEEAKAEESEAEPETVQEEPNLEKESEPETVLEEEKEAVPEEKLEEEPVLEKEEAEPVAEPAEDQEKEAP